MRRIILWLLLLVVATARLYGYRLQDAPPHVEIDEVLIALDAHAIATTGRDLRGELLPLYSQTAEHSWYQPMVIYATAVAMSVLPLSEWSVRVPTVCIAVLDVALMYLLIRQLFGSDLLGAIAASLLALTPAHFIHTRYGMDYVYPVPFVLAWLLCLVSYRQSHRPRWLLLGSLVLGVGFYSYIASIVLMPIYAVLTFLLLYHERADRRRYYLVAAGFLPLLLPFLIWLMRHPSAYAATMTKYGVYDVNQLNAAQGLRSVVSYLSIGQRLSQYWNFFNPSFLFFGGGTKLMFSTNLVGVFLLPLAFFIVAGMYAAIRSWREEPLFLIVLLGFLTAPLAALIVIEENAIFRALTMVPFGILIATIGVREAWLWAARSARWPSLRGLAVAAAAAGAAYGIWAFLKQSHISGSALALMGVAAAILLVDRLRDSSQQWRLAVIAVLALIPLQFRGFWHDYFTDYRVRSAYWLGGNIGGALEAIIARDNREHVPAIYFSTLESTAGQVDGRNQYMDAYWKFYLTKHGRQDLLSRTRAFDPARVSELLKGSLVLANLGAVGPDTAVRAGDLRVVETIGELDRSSFFVVLQR